MAGPGRADGDAECARRSGGLDAAKAGQAAPPPKEFDQAIALRETLYRLFDAQAQGKTPPARDLDALNEALAQAPARTTLKRGRDGYDWDVDTKSGTALALLAPVLWSAGDLLAGPRLDGCGAAPIPNAAGCSSTTAARASGAGARCGLRQPRQGAAPLSQEFGEA